MLPAASVISVAMVTGSAAAWQIVAEIAEALDVSKAQAKQWLNRLVEEGVLKKIQRSLRYRPAAKYPRQHQLFG